jgi:hypothetical protein
MGCPLLAQVGRSRRQTKTRPEDRAGSSIGATATGAQNRTPTILITRLHCVGSPTGAGRNTWPSRITHSPTGYRHGCE